MKKRIISVLLIFALSFGLAPSGAGASAETFDLDAYADELSRIVQESWDDEYITGIEFRINDTEMTVNGETAEVDPGRDTAPFISDEGRTMLPVRVISETLGCEVGYDGTTGEVTITGDEIEISLTIGDETMTVNGEEIILDSPPVVVDDRTFIPVRAVAESLLLEVDYINEGQRVTLTEPFQTRRLIVQTDRGQSTLDRLDGIAEILPGPDNTYILQFDSEIAAKNAAEVLEASGISAEPDVIVSVDSYRSWGVEHMGAPAYIDYLETVDKPNVTVAVLDTGIDAAHPLLAGRVLEGVNYSTSSQGTRDIHSHGTHVTGTIAEMTHSNVKFIPVKVLGDNGRGARSMIDLGIRYAADRGADVINMSLGGSGTSYSTRSAVLYANGRDAVVVVAAGNENSNAANFTPANIPEVITVAASDSLGGKAYFSNFGSVIDVAAPGVGIISSVPGGGYSMKSGTSMASPHVAAVVALLKSDSRYEDYSPSEIEALIHGLTTDAGAPGFDEKFGHGIVNLRSLDFDAPEPLPGDAQPPVIISQPQDARVSRGAEHPLTVAAESPDGGRLSYQWYRKSSAGWTQISGAMNATYLASGYSVGTTEYYCLVTNTNSRVSGNRTAQTESAAAAEDVEFVPVTEITGVPAECEAKVPLVLSGEVRPANATNKTIAWSVLNARGTGAAISGAILKANSAGTVTLKATITNGLSRGTAYTQYFDIAVTAPQPVDEYTLTITIENEGWVYPTVTDEKTGALIFGATISNQFSGDDEYTFQVPAGAYVKLDNYPGNYAHNIPNSRSGAMDAVKVHHNTFKTWAVVSGDIRLSDPMNDEITFFMPRGDAEIKVVFERDECTCFS